VTVSVLLGLLDLANQARGQTHEATTPATNLDLFAAGSGPTGFSSPVATKSPFIMKTYTYKTIGDLKIQADVYRRDDGQPRPVLLWLHGGALVVGNRQNIRPDLLDLCRAEGYCLVSADHRLAPEVKLPQIIEDLRDLIRWVNEKGPGAGHGLGGGDKALVDKATARAREFIKEVLGAQAAPIAARASARQSAPAQPATVRSYELAFSTYFGGSGGDLLRDITVDAQGNIYVAGIAGSADFPRTPGNLPGQSAAGSMLAKFSPTGKLLWSKVVKGPFLYNLHFRRIQGLPN
jgi:hypothetical protein